MVDVNRIIDTAPHSRNESIASFLRIVRICEERGSGFDRMEEGMSDLLIPALKSVLDYKIGNLHDPLADFKRKNCSALT